MTYLSSRLDEKIGVDLAAYLGAKRWDQPALNLTQADWDRHRAQVQAHEAFKDFEIQCRADDESMLALLAALDDAEARAETTAERAFLRALGGGCAAPVAALATVVTTPRVRLQGLVASVDGRDVVRVNGEGNPHEIGEHLAEDALSRGADRILAGVR